MLRRRVRALVMASQASGAQPSWKVVDGLVAEAAIVQVRSSRLARGVARSGPGGRTRWPRRARRAAACAGHPRGVVRSESSTPARPASERSAVGKSTPSRSMTKLKMSPPRPQPKHCQRSRVGVTVNEGVFSPWNGQRPLNVVPAFLSWTVSPMSSTMSSFSLMVAATPIDNLDVPLRLDACARCAASPTRSSWADRRARVPSAGAAGGHTSGLVKS